MECCRYHRPEPIGYQREEHRGTRPEQIDRKVSDVEARIFRRYKQVQHLIRCDHHCRNQCHRPLRAAASSEGVADCHEHEDEEGRNAHPRLVPCSWLSVKLAQATAESGTTLELAVFGHS